MIALKTFGKRTDKFLEISQKILYDYGGKITFLPKQADSYFEFDSNLLGIFSIRPRNKTVWLETYIHEYCHFLQKLYKTDAYREYMKMRKGCYSLIYNWLFLHENTSKSDIKRAFALTRNLEHECEKMSVLLVRQFDLPINTEQIQRKGNAYLCFYHAVEKHRQWNTKMSIYHREILSEMPCLIQSSYVENIPAKKLKVIENCFKEKNDRTT